MGVRQCFTLLFAAFLFSGNAGTANGGAEPDNVAAEVENAAQKCKRIGGTPDTAAVLRAVDFTGLGSPDWIVDYAKLRCQGQKNPFCEGGACVLHLYVRVKDAHWERLFSEPVRQYRLTKFGGRPALQVTTSGKDCRVGDAGSCTLVYSNGNVKRIR